jgi:chromosomal replication initiation ATPase DnaA
LRSSPGSLVAKPDAILAKPVNPGAKADIFRGKRREEKSLEICEGMIDLASALFNVCSKELRRAGRTAAGVARVRQIAMYVTHVSLGLTMSEVGRGFGRDRTTVLHACHLIEDMRDDIGFDRIVQTVERVARAAFANRSARFDD